MSNFIRQAELERNLVSLMVPQGIYPPNQFQFDHFRLENFYYFRLEHFDNLLKDGAEVSEGIYTFEVRQGVLEIFETVAWSHRDFGWSFASSRVVDVLAAVRIGETMDVYFGRPFAEIYKISRHHFPPPGVPNSGYGQYKIHICEDVVRPEGFRIISGFEERQAPTKSRLPFFFGFRVFGRGIGDEPEAIWRNFLGASIRYCQEKRWPPSVLHAAFSLESFIDTLLRRRMLEGGLSESYIEHILRVGEKHAEFHALNEMLLNGRYTKSQINSLYERLNTIVFSKRNGLAHGRLLPTQITQQDALQAIREVVSFIWDFDQYSRKELLIVTGPISFEKMIDNDLLQSCIHEI